MQFWSANLTHFVHAGGRSCSARGYPCISRTVRAVDLSVAPHAQPQRLNQKASTEQERALHREDPMIPGSFVYHLPSSVQEAVGLLTDLGDEARALAGGHSLIPMMKLRLATPAHLVDLAGVGELRGIRADGSDIVVGAMTTQHDLI